MRPRLLAKESLQAVAEAVEELPLFAKNLCSPTSWQLEARQLAEGAVTVLPLDASYERKKASASEAVAAVSQRYERHEEARRHRQLCEQIANGGGISLELKQEDWEEASEAIREGLAELPVGSSKRQLDAVKDRVLEPLKLRKLRGELVQPGRGALGWEATADDYAKAGKGIADRLATLPEDTGRTQLESVREEVLEKSKRRLGERKQEQERHRAAEFKAKQAVLHVDRYLGEVYEFGTIFEEMRIERELREEIEPRLVDKLLEGDMDTQEVENFVEECVEESFRRSD